MNINMRYAVPALVSLAMVVGCSAQHGAAAEPPLARETARATTGTVSASPTPTPTPTPKTKAELAAPFQEAAGRGEPVDCATLACIALTFDDGPGDMTPALLQQLTKEHVPAVFFMQGSYVSRNPGFVGLIANTPGMEVGNHTLTHPFLTKIGTAQVNNEVVGQHNNLLSHGATKVTWMRPSYGEYDNRTLAACASVGEAVVTWSDDTKDWQNRSTEQTTANAVQQAKPGAVILMHDIHPTSVAAVPGIIAQLKAQGYVFVNLTQLLGAPKPGQLFDIRGK